MIVHNRFYCELSIIYVSSEVEISTCPTSNNRQFTSWNWLCIKIRDENFKSKVGKCYHQSDNSWWSHFIDNVEIITLTKAIRLIFNIICFQFLLKFCYWSWPEQVHGTKIKVSMTWNILLFRLDGLQLFTFHFLYICLLALYTILCWFL